MKKRVIFFSFCMLLALGTATLVFNSCSKDDSGLNNSSTPEKGVVINGVKWATRNVDKPGTFAAKPEDSGMFYQLDRKIGWSASNPMVNSNGGKTWDSSYPVGYSWEESNDPSPTDWRLPNPDEIDKLLDTDNVSNEWTTENGVSGRKFTDKATGNSLFLPAAGYRDSYAGELSYVGTNGTYWCSTMITNVYANSLFFGSNYAKWNNGSSDGIGRYFGNSARSVAK